MFTWTTEIVKAVIDTLDHFIISTHSPSRIMYW